ncbi:MAG: YIP1 family protein [Nitrospirota bacterium]
MIDWSFPKHCLGVMIFPKNTFTAVSEHHNERHVISLSMIFGLLFARQIMHSENHDLVFYVVTALASGVGFVYFAGFFLSWLIRIGGSVLATPAKMRSVLSYAFVPYILALSLLALSRVGVLPKTSAIAFFFIVLSWGLAVFGIKTVSEIKTLQALFVMVVPVAALVLIIAILYKIAWVIWGY